MEGHTINGTDGTCEHGHLPADQDTHDLDMQSMMSMMLLQQKIMQMQMEQQVKLLEQSHRREQALNEALQHASSGSSTSKVNRPKRPLLECDAKDHEWEFFLDSWERYKEVVKLSDISAIRYELRQSCSDEINQMLLGFIGRDKLNVASEKELLEYIKSVAVVVVHKEVHRQNFGKMEQEEGESITHYVARLKTQAMLCEFTVPNPDRLPQVSFPDSMIATQMISGLRNKEHQSSVLRDAVTLSSFKSTFDRLLTLETTDKSTPHLGNRSNACPSASTMSAALKSQYRRNKFKKSTPKASEEKEKQHQEVKKCRGCGRTTRPGGKPLSRNHCPAEGQICSNCGIKNHFAVVCEQRRSSSQNNSQRYNQREEGSNVNHESSEQSSISHAQSISFLNPNDEEPFF